MALSNHNDMDGRFETSLQPSAIHSVLAVCQAMGAAIELDQVLHTVLEQSLAEMCAQEGSIVLFDERDDRLKMLAQIGLPDEIAAKGYIPRKGSIAEWVIENNQPLIMNDTPTASEYRPLDYRRRIVSSMCVPLRAHGCVLGTINLNRTDPTLGNFNDETLDVMVILANQAAIFIENSRLHEAALKSERLAAVGQTVAGISHCIKNVLTGVKGGMSLIEMATRAEKWDMLLQGEDILKRNLERLSSIVLDMLDYSKEREAVKHPLPVADLLDELIATCSSEARAREVTLENRGVGDAVRVSADSHKLYRSMLNLVHNAIDATPRGGTVWLAAERTEDPAPLRRMIDRQAAAAVVLRVGDTGPGIAEEHRRSIFEPFFSTKGSKGTGLGLAVTAKIVEEHGGYIEVETAAPNPAVFAIYLPA